MEGSPVQEEVGGNVNDGQQSGIPTSPSSSGGFHQFPSKGYVEKICLHDIYVVEILEI